MTTGVSVRALASPGFALALVVLVLNDHVLKTAYPGWITGKLSDVAGLVLAPLLLGVLLTVWRVPRPMLVAIVVVGLGFTSSTHQGRDVLLGRQSHRSDRTVAAAAAASDLWSLHRHPHRRMRADITDLLCAACPVRRLAGAPSRRLAAAGQPASRGRAGDRRRAAAGRRARDSRDVVRQRPGRSENLTVFTRQVLTRARGASEERIGVSGDVMAGDGSVASIRPRVVDLPDEGVRRQVHAACDDDGTCWRIDPGVDYVPSVQMSTDGGTTWTRDLWVTARRTATQHSVDVPLGCDEEPSPPRPACGGHLVVAEGRNVGPRGGRCIAARRSDRTCRTVGGRWSPSVSAGGEADRDRPAGGAAQSGG